MAAKRLVTGKLLWRVSVVRNKIEPGLEEDVQESFITELKLERDMLVVRDEKSRCFNIDLYQHHVKKCVLTRP